MGTCTSNNSSARTQHVNSTTQLLENVLHINSSNLKRFRKQIRSTFWTAQQDLNDCIHVPEYGTYFVHARAIIDGAGFCWRDNITVTITLNTGQVLCEKFVQLSQDCQNRQIDVKCITPILSTDHTLKIVFSEVGKASLSANDIARCHLDTPTFDLTMIRLRGISRKHQYN